MAEEDDERDEDHREWDRRFQRSEQPGESDTSRGPRFDGAAVPGHALVGGAGWRSVGPLNLAGRIRALAVDPVAPVGGGPRVVYAGSASGGVFRTLDGGQSWESIWDPDLPSLSIGCIAIGDDGAGARTIWVGTGEKDKQTSAGVWRADLAAGIQAPVAFVQAGTVAAMFPGVAVGSLPVLGLEAAAVDPADPTHCWFVSPVGVFRIRGGVWSVFEHTAGGRTAVPYTDVKFVRSPIGRYVLLSRGNTLWGDIVMIRNPDAAAAAIQAIFTAAVVGAGPGFALGAELAAPLLPAAPPPPITAPTLRCRNARLAVVPAAAAAGQDRVYVAYTTFVAGADHEQPLHGLRHAAAIDQDPGTAQPRWTLARTWADRTPPAHMRDNQGDYNLVLAVSPAAGDLIICGLLNVYISDDAGVTWRRALDWHRYDTGDWGQHADQHAAVFVPQPAAAPALWMGNDGGVAVTTGYIDPVTGHPPLDAGQYRWRRRIHGLVVSQAYDLAQSPLLPDMQAVALQDIGGWLTAGSTTWYHVQGGDGIGITFDAFDPYHLIAGWQGRDNSVEGCDDVLFVGSMGVRWDARRYNVPAVPPAPPPPAPRPAGRTLGRFRGFAPHRPIGKGVVPDDRATFDETVTHPTQPGRMLHLRRRRAYFSEDGETFRVCNAGNRIELFGRLTHEGHVAGSLGGITLEVGGPAALKLGFLPGVTSDLREHATASVAPAPGRRPALDIYRARVINGARPPYTLVAADALTITIDVMVASQAAPNRYRTTVTANFPAGRSYTLEEVLTRVRAVLPSATAAVWIQTWLPAAPPPPLVALPADVVLDLHCLPTSRTVANTLLVVSDAVGAAADIVVGGVAVAASMRVQPRTYLGDAGRPAVVTLHALAEDILTGIEAAAPPMPVGSVLDLTTDAGGAAPAMHYTFAGGGAAVGAWDRYAPPLRERIQRERDNPVATPHPPAVRFWATQAKKYLRLWSGRLGAAPLATFRIPADPISTARAGISSDNPTLLDRATPFLFVDLRPRLWGRYDLTPSAGPGPDSVLRIEINGVNTDITFTAANFGAGLTGVTVEEARRVINTALAGSDVFCDVQHEYEGEGPSEAVFSQVDDRVMWLGGRWAGLYVSRDRGDTWTDVTDYTDEYLMWQTVEGIAPDDTVPANAADPVGALVGMAGRIQHVTSAGVRVNRDTGLTRPAGYAGGGIAKVFAVERGGRGSHEVFAATDVGVFRSPDDGNNWDTFNEGLPAVMAIDLAYEPTTETLRVATWGRGVYERVIGNGPAAPAPLFVRANDRDTGRGPAPHGPALGGDRPAALGAFESPDVRLTRLPAADLDSVELDELVSEPAIPGQVYTVLVRGHNGSTGPVADARLIALWADASRQVPPLPAQFWTDIGNPPPLAAGPWGPWRLIGEARVGAIPSGSARIGRFAHTWAAGDLAGRSQLAVLLVAVVGRNAVEAGPSETARLATTHPQLALRMVPVQVADVPTITLEALSGARFSGFVAFGPADPFVFAPVPGARVVSTAATATFNVAGLQLAVDLQEPWPPPLVATTNTILIDFADGGFTNPAAATPAEVRAFLAVRLGRENRLARVVAPAPALALARSPGERGPRVGGAAWSSAELVITAPGTAATADDFSFLRLLAPATVRIGSAQRFSLRVHNRGGADAAGATMTIYAIDPRAENPTLTALNAAPAAVPVIPAGGSAIGFVEGTIAAVSGADVLLLAVVTHPGDPAPGMAPLPTTWPVVLALNEGSDNLAMRILRRA